MKHLLKAAALAVLVAQAAAAADLETRIASVAPEGTPWLDSLLRYEDAAEAASNGAVDVVVYPAGQLGDEQQILAQVRRGRIEGGFLSAPALSALIPELGMLETPFLWESPEELDYVVDTAVFDALKPLFAEKGLILVDVTDVGWIHILSEPPVLLPEDARGLKPRAVESKTSMGFWTELGANPVALPYTDVLPSLQTGLVNGTDNELISIFFSEFYKAAKNLTLTHHSYQLGALVLSKAWYDGLTPEQQAAVITLSDGERARSRAEVRGLQEWILAQLGEAGVAIHRLSPEQLAAWRARFEGFDTDLTAALGGGSDALYQDIQMAKRQYREKAGE